MAKWDMKSYLRLILNLNMKTKIGSPYSSRCTFYRHVFAHIYYVIHELARTDIYLERTLIPLLIVIKRWTWYQNAWKNVPNMMTEKIGEIICCRTRKKCQNAQKTRAHARLSDFLSNAYNGLKRMQKKLATIWSIFKFYARVNARTNAYARICARFLIWNWPEGYWSYSW